MGEEMRIVNVKTLQGEVKEISISSEAQIQDFKQVISDAFGVAPDCQRLICKGKLLKDGTPLSDYVTQDGENVQLLIRSVAPEERPQVQARNPAPPEQPAAAAQPGAQPGAQPNPLGNMMNMVGNLLGGNAGAQGGPGQLDFGQLMNQMMPMVQNMVPQMMQNLQQPAANQQAPAAAQQRPAEAPQQAAPAAAPAAPPAAAPPAAPAQPAGPAVFELPFQHVSAMGDIVNHLSGPQSGFPPPVLPQLNVPRNPVVLLGGYLYNYQLQVLRLLPFISRLGDLCQRESLMADPSHRQNVQFLSNHIGAALAELEQATGPVVEMLRTLQLGAQPGQFSMQAGGRNVVSQPNQPQQHQHGQQRPPN